jgi:hypothetical protein
VSVSDGKGRIESLIDVAIGDFMVFEWDFVRCVRCEMCEMCEM